MGRWSRKIANKFLSWLQASHDLEGKNWIDVGCGTGALSHEILNKTGAHYVMGIDPAIEYLSASNLPKLEFKVGNSDQIPSPPFEIDFVVSGLAFNFMPNLNGSLIEMRSKLKNSGIIALYVWDYSSKMEFLRYFWDVVVEIDPEARTLDEGQLFNFCNLEQLETMFTLCELLDVSTEVIDIATDFKDFEEYWNPFLGGQGPAGAYLASCSDERLEEIKTSLRNRLPSDEDGSISLIARALAIKGTKAVSR